MDSAGSWFVYLGGIIALAGVISLIRPIRTLGIRTRKKALVVTVFGLVLSSAGFLLPATLTRVDAVRTRLDEFAPEFQFREFHSVEVAASSDRVWAAVKEVTPDEIRLYGTLTWIRRLGRKGPESILQAAGRRPILDAATRRWFTVLAEDAGQEIVLGALGTGQGVVRGAPAEFQAYQESPYTKIAFNFRVEERGPQRCIVTTETRVYCVGAGLRKKFACYWRVIHPGSSIIRWMWLRAIRQRAEA